MLHLRLLGTSQIFYHQTPITGLSSAKSQALLQYLALQGKPQSRLTLSGLFWPEKGDKEALMNLRQALYQVRLSLPGEITATRGAVSLNPEIAIEIDARQFEAQANRGLGGDIAALHAAADLFTGEFMAGTFLQDAPGFEEWMLLERERLRSLAIQVLHQLSQHYASHREIGPGLAFTGRLLALEPWREESHFQMIQLLAWDGQISAAIAQYERCRQMLVSELGVPPSPATEALYQQLLTGEFSRAVPAIPVPQPTPAELPPNNLPTPLASFIGRAQEITAIQQYFSAESGSTRLLTLTGPGGVGKTELSLKGARTLLGKFPDGVWLIEFAPLADPELVPQAVAAALGVREAAALANVLQAHLQNKNLLLLFDNCEHLLPACAALAGHLLAACPQLKILATSQEPLKLDEEQVYSVVPLEMPDPAKLPPFPDLQRFPAIQLFIDRAQAAWPKFEFTPENAQAVAAICHQLGGIPLALELAAVRVSALSVEKIAERLDHRFRLLTRGRATAMPRHQTLRALVDWSYELLSEPERILLRRLSIFAGSWSLQSAEAICARQPDSPSPQNEIHPIDVLDLLIWLVDKSLVIIPEIRGEDTRYRMLDTIRQYAYEKLVEAHEEALTRHHHARYFLQLAEQAEPELIGRSQPFWVAQLEANIDNLRSAQSWWLGSDPHTALQLAGWLGKFWDLTGRFTEGLDHLTQALNAAPGAPHQVQILAMKWASALAFRQSRFNVARSHLEKGRLLAEQIGDDDNLASIYNILGLITETEGSSIPARAYLERSLELRRKIGDLRGTAVALGNLGLVAREIGDIKAALEYSLESLAIAREINDPSMIATRLNGVAETHLCLANLAEAEKCEQEALALQKKLGNIQGGSFSLMGLGVIAWARRDYTLAKTYLHDSDRIRHQIGDRAGIAYLHHLLGVVAISEKDIPAARVHYTQGLALSQEIGNMRNFAACVEGFAQIALLEGAPQAAVQLWAAAQNWRETAHAPVQVFFRAYHENAINQARQALGEPAFKENWALGKNRTLSQALAAVEITTALV